MPDGRKRASKPRGLRPVHHRLGPAMFAIIQERIAQQCTIRQMAERTGWSYSAVWNYEQGLKPTPLAYAEHAAQVLGMKSLPLTRRKEQHVPTTYRITLDLEVNPPPKAPTNPTVKEYVAQAVKNWGGAYRPDDPLFSAKLRVLDVTVRKRRPPALPKPKQARALTRGDMAVDGEGNVARVFDPRDVTGLVWLEYGGNGPFRMWHPDSVRHATLAEINAAGLSGVGRNRTPEETGEGA